MKQDFRTGQLDVLTAGELSKALHEHFHESRFSAFFREEYKGVNIKRIPPLLTTAATTSPLLNAPSGATPCGPESGFIWRIESLFLESSANGFTTAALINVVVGATTVATANLNSVPVLVQVSGGTVTQITINGVNTNQTAGTFLLKPGDLISTTNTGAPTYTTTLPSGVSLPTTFNDTATGALFIGSDQTNTRQVNEVDRKPIILGQRYYPSSKGLWVWPSEQIYLQLTGATVNNVYTLTGIVAEVPAEMKGKLI